MERIPICYGYGRHSTNKQELTKGAQEAKVREYFERVLKPRGVAWGGFFYDPATSGRVPFSERENGKIVHAVSQPGDHIVVARLDRPFRSLRDGVGTIHQWDARGVRFHSLDLQVDTSTPIGKFFRDVLLAVAELERSFAKERRAETATHRMSQGKPHSRGCPIGWKVVGDGPDREFRVDDAERAFIDAMAKLKSKGWTHEDIADWTRKQKQWIIKRCFPNRGQARAALNARRLGYPKITDYKRINRMATQGREA